EGCRTIFLLHEVEGYEHNEIASMLRCSVGNSKSQLHKARLKIREILLAQPTPEEKTLAAKRETARPAGRKKHARREEEPAWFPAAEYELSGKAGSAPPNSLPASRLPFQHLM
ncbi:MAG TPA: sigma factor-like helix-turn-helix DNA-binding protein, partial [Terriglobales bacterium]|nr:sigma factor-like helix-turn-helix DNA-binding protein [Terriglobales bacterium]